MNKDLVKKIVEKIKVEDIKPESRFRISAKNYAYWVVLIFIAVIGALFFSLALMNLIGVDFLYYFGFKKVVHFLMLTAPYFWIFLSMVAVTLGVLSFRKTKMGYRANTLLVVSMTILAISILSVVMHFSKLDSRFEKGVAKSFPKMHQDYMSPKEGKMFQPDNGVIAGRVVDFSDKSIFIQNRNSDVWSVNVSRKTKIQKDLKVKRGMRIIIFGEKSGKNSFDAKIIKSFNPAMKQSMKGSDLNCSKCKL
ncbi:hypothetical protein ACFL08_05070 [Patescibacteria group bacterium]